jgi:signal transduction histidine kinase
VNEHLNVAVDDKEGIVAYVAATGSSFLSGNVHNEPRYRKLFSNTASEIAVPVRDRHGRIRAVINAESDLLDAYHDRERNICDALASIVSIVLDREEMHKRQEALIEIGGALDNSLTEEALIDRLLHVAGDVLRFQACSVFLLDPKTDKFVLRGSVGRLKDQVGRIAYERGQGFTGWVCEHGEPIMLHDPQQDPRWKGKYTEFPSAQIASFLAVPIEFRNRAIGAIRVLRRKSDNPFLDNRFTESDQSVLEAIADQVASGLENIRNLEKVIRSERMIAWGELSAKSSHMIGNRVFALKGDVNELQHLLDADHPDLKELRDLQQSLAVNLTRIEEILQDFRDFVTATQLNKEPGDINQLIRETLDEVFPRRSRVHLVVNLEEGLPMVDMDSKRLRRAISELIENSMNYMDLGQLTVCTSQVDRGHHAATRRSNSKRFVQIEIEDTGPGIQDAEKAVIFQPFFSNRVKGMGLGLSIVKGIVDAHGGEVFEAGEKGKGAKFVILLPVANRP